MKHLKLTVSLNADSVEQLKAAAAFVENLYQLAVASGSAKVAVEDFKKAGETATDEQEKKARSITSKVTVGTKPQLNIEYEKEAVPTAQSSKVEYKIEDVRSSLALKVQDHREAIKAMLTKLGAANVTLLDPSKYEEFVTFLNGL